MVRLVLLLTENWTLTSPRDLRGLVEMAVEAEKAGFDSVMASEHIVLGPGSSAITQMVNPREFLMPGNQDPTTPHPSTIVLLSAIAAATSKLRLIAGAIIPPLRHPLLLAKELATLDLLSEGRLTVIPTVSWHRDEYEALGVPWHSRGQLLDEHLAAWKLLWSETPASFTGRHYQFEDTYFEPKPYRPKGPSLWFGGSSVHPRLLRRLVAYGDGFAPLLRVTAEDMSTLSSAMIEAGRDISELEMVAGVMARLPDAESTADLDRALAVIPKMVASGFSTIILKPAQFIDDRSEFPGWCREVVSRVSEL